MTPLTRHWVRKAEEDWRIVLLFKDARPPFHDAVCFRSQQTAEKYLKGLIQERGKTPRRTFDLGRLLNDVLKLMPTFGGSRRRLTAMTKFGDDLRYHNGVEADARKSRMAFRTASEVRAEVRRALGIRGD
jgi:HEPN domain-containing protein